MRKFYHGWSSSLNIVESGTKAGGIMKQLPTRQIKMSPTVDGSLCVVNDDQWYRRCGVGLFSLSF